MLFCNCSLDQAAALSKPHTKTQQNKSNTLFRHKEYIVHKLLRDATNVTSIVTNTPQYVV